MKITIMRFGRYHHAVSGKLLIDGQLMCGTLENFDRMLPPGDYGLGHDRRRVVTPYYLIAGASAVQMGASAVQMGASAVQMGIPKGKGKPLGGKGKPLGGKVSPRCIRRFFLSPGNGVEGRRKGRILLGETLYLGFLVHSQEAYERVTDRLRMLPNCPRAVVVSIRQSEDYFEVA